ncbi:MAG: nicotinate (nicotinamide) nucleotide adenylyltransferase [Oscillospiraceae bacterium]|jgi:nicotinate-nucleotide adenylyltransferase|nr:nicotinate (nicotinamide) nucleotide adenylyltransferase [Oscillospiraceae bacterium]
MKNIGIFGGSFHPPHEGHARAAKAFLEQMELDLLYIVPAGKSPGKRRLFGATSADRVAMCGRTFCFDRRIRILNFELQRAGDSHTIDTLLHLRQTHPDASFYLLVGTDQLAQFDQWKSWETILDLATVVALPRDASPLHIPKAFNLRQQQHTIRLRSFRPLQISSTQLRACRRGGADISGWITEATNAYIQTKNLYAPLTSHRACKAFVAELVDPKRLYHSECVAETAFDLACKYGQNEHKALLAGMLHDCAKQLPPEEQRQLCAQYGKPLRGIDDGFPQVWHAFAGEALLSMEGGISDPAILGAVRWHTTGHAGMTAFEKVIFVADMTSVDRKFPDVQTVRDFVQTDLDDATRYIIGYFIREKKREDTLMHPDGLACYAELEKMITIKDNTAF